MRVARVLACLGALAMLLAGAGRTDAAGALATGTCGAFGYSFNDYSPEAAALRARAQCKGKDCQVVTRFRKSCAAFAIDSRNACGPHGWAQASTLGRAQNVAAETCQRYGGRNCVIRVWVCDAKG